MRERGLRLVRGWTKPSNAIRCHHEFSRLALSSKNQLAKLISDAICFLCLEKGRWRGLIRVISGQEATLDVK